MTDPRDLADLLSTLARLKRTKRTGWLDRGLDPAKTESVADHSLLTALIAWLAALEDPTLDETRVLKLALIHDIAEAIVGDRPPYEPEDVPDPADRDAHARFFSVRHHRSAAGKIAKAKAEHDAFAAMTANLAPMLRAELADLWQEYETRATPEARFVKQADTLEAFLESRYLAEVDPTLPVGGFADMAAHELDHPRLTAIRDAAAKTESSQSA